MKRKRDVLEYRDCGESESDNGEEELENQNLRRKRPRIQHSIPSEGENHAMYYYPDPLERSFLEEVEKRGKGRMSLRRRILEIIQFICSRSYSRVVKRVELLPSKSSNFMIQISKKYTLICVQVSENPLHIQIKSCGNILKEQWFMEKEDISFSPIRKLLNETVPFNTCEGFSIENYVTTTFNEVFLLKRVDVTSIGINDKEYSVGIFSEDKLVGWLNFDKRSVKSSVCQKFCENLICSS